MISHIFCSNDLVDSGERGPASLQVLIACVDLGLLGERGAECPTHLLMMEIGTLTCSKSVRVG